MKLSLFADDMIVYMDNPIDPTKKLLELISELGKIQDTKPIFRNRRHFCTPTMKYQKQKSGNKIPFATATRKINYLGINLTKEVKDLYLENYTTLKKKLRKTQINGSIYCVHGLEVSTSSKCSYIQRNL